MSCAKQMKHYKFTFLLVIAALAFFGRPAIAQESFSDVNVDYTFAVPDTKWKMTVKPSATSPNVEYVNGDRVDGHFEVRRLTVPRDAVLTDIIRDEEQKVQFRPGFVAGKEENFSGRLRGAIYNFEYVAAGKSMSGRFYFLRANENTVYLLRFTGQKDTLRSVRHQTDSIARTFTVK
ncbi:MAG TPA: hypothetical protein VNA17_00200 [Pyrinomonadaceae bacterium]|nr:hypothetical protein [Pyrinomonadaceae bacterium]